MRKFVLGYLKLASLILLMGWGWGAFNLKGIAIKLIHQYHIKYVVMYIVKYREEHTAKLNEDTFQLNESLILHR